MKRLIVAFSILAFATVIEAAEPVTVIPGPNSQYSDTNGTVALSSFTVATFSSVSGYRELKLQAGTSFFYVEDAGKSSASDIRTNGLSVAADTIATIESNQAVRVILPVGVSAVTGRYRERLLGQ